MNINQSNPVPSEVDVERAAKEMYGYCYDPPNLWPLTQNYTLFIDCARHHLEQTQKYKDEQTQSLIVVDRLCVERDTLRAELATVKRELETLKLENKNANGLIGLQADENDKINSALKSEVSRLREALRKHGIHLPTHNCSFNPDVTCTCGLSQVLESTSKTDTQT